MGVVEYKIKVKDARISLAETRAKYGLQSYCYEKGRRTN